jgi:hypothetical protein
MHSLFGSFQYVRTRYGSLSNLTRASGRGQNYSVKARGFAERLCFAILKMSDGFSRLIVGRPRLRHSPEPGQKDLRRKARSFSAAFSGSRPSRLLAPCFQLGTRCVSRTENIRSLLRDSALKAQP